jgi:MFS family permease
MNRGSYSRIPDDGSSLMRSNLHPDAKLLFGCKIARLFGFGFLAVMLVLYLTELQFSETETGMLFTLTLLGDAIISLAITGHADRWGRRKCLILGTLMALSTSIIFITQRNFMALLFAGILGVISPSGAEIGPFMAIEISSLSQVTPNTGRTKLLAWYNLWGCVSTALGAICCGGLLVLCQSSTGLAFSPLDSYRVVLVVYTLTQLVLLFLCISLGPDIEVHPTTITTHNTNPVSLFFGLHRSKGIVLQLSLLFMMDAFAGGWIVQSMISEWFADTYKTPYGRLGLMLFICNIFAGISAICAAKIAEYIGLVMTMVVTHLPSNVLTIMVPLMPNESLAVATLCLRFSISQMDVPTRNAYVQGVVDADERSAANGVTNVARSLGVSAAPLLAGMLYAHPMTKNYPFYIAGMLKIVYDILLLWSFRSVPSDSDSDLTRTSATTTYSIVNKQ